MTAIIAEGYVCFKRADLLVNVRGVLGTVPDEMPAVLSANIAHTNA